MKKYHNNLHELTPVITKQFDKISSLPIPFTLIVLFSGIFGGSGLYKKPKILNKLIENQIFRLFCLICLGYTATGNIEHAIVATLIFIIVINFLYTKEEKENNPII